MNQMPSAQPSPIEAELMEIMREYYRALPDRLAEIRKSWERTETEAVPGDAFEEFYRQVHSLAGKSGTYRMDKVGKAARGLQNVLHQLREGSRMPSIKEREVIDEWLGRIAEMCAPFIEEGSKK